MDASSPSPRADDPEQLAVGTRVTLRRHMPSQAHEDAGWTVTGYTTKSRGRWLGYELQRDDGRTTSASRFEVMEKAG